MESDDGNVNARKNRSIGALLSGARNTNSSAEESENNDAAPPPPKRSILDDLTGADQGFDFSSMGTMGDFSGWGFGAVEEEKNDNDGGGGRDRSNSRWGNDNNDNRGRGGRDRDSRGGGGGGRGDRGRGGRDGFGRNQGDRRNSGSWKRNDDDDENNGDNGGWNRGRKERDGGRDRSRSNDKPQARPGDWDCSECEFKNFASRSQCFKCNAPKGDQRRSGGGYGNDKSSGLTGANVSSLGRRRFQSNDDEDDGDQEGSHRAPPREQEKRPRLDEDVYGPNTITSWTDIKEYDDDHDAEMFKEENEYLTQRYGEGSVRVRYTNQGVVGYYCMICDVEMTGEKPLDLHCRGMKHLKKKERRDNPSPLDPPPPPRDRRANQDRGEKSKPKLLPPEAFSRGNQGSGQSQGYSPGRGGGQYQENSGSDPGSSGAGLTGGPTGTLLSKLADCSVKSEGDAELATNVIGLLLKSLKDYSVKKGESKVAELLLQAELKMSTIKALKVGLQYLSGSQQEGKQSYGGGGSSSMHMGMGGHMDRGMGGHMDRGMGGHMDRGMGGSRDRGMGRPMGRGMGRPMNF